MRILLIKRGAIGDILMTTALLRQLKQNNPTAIIDYCTTQGMQSVLNGNTNLDQIITLADKAFTLQGIYQFIRFILINRYRYDYVFILGKSWHANLLCRLFSAITIGFAREFVSKLILNKYVEYNDVERYQGLYYLDLLACSNLARVDYSDIKLDLAITDVDINKIDRLLQSHNLVNFVVVVNSGGNNQFESGGIRMLPEDLIINLITGLLKQNFSVILVGGGMDKDNYQNYVNRLNKPNGLYNWANQLSLAQSYYLIKLSKRFYTTDCGAMHLGIVANKKTAMTAIFGPTNPRHIIPNINEHKIIWHDQNIFDASYQLEGKLKHSHPEFFSTITVSDII